jgi:glutamate formiminotransferase
MVHNIIYFFKDNLTIPKTKDLVSLTEKKYEEIYNIMKNNKSLPEEKEYHQDDDIDNRSVDSSTTFIDSLPSSLDMKEELKNFLKLHQ